MYIGKKKKKKKLTLFVILRPQERPPPRPILSYLARFSVGENELAPSSVFNQHSGIIA